MMSRYYSESSCLQNSPQLLHSDLTEITSRWFKDDETVNRGFSSLAMLDIISSESFNDIGELGLLLTWYSSTIDFSTLLKSGFGINAFLGFDT